VKAYSLAWQFQAIALKLEKVTWALSQCPYHLPVVVRMGEGMVQLRAKAEHYRRLAKLLTDQQAARQLLEIAIRFETEASSLEAVEKDGAQKPPR
jgi:hypothetical protein